MGRGLGPDSGGLGWCYVRVSCEPGLFVYMAGPWNPLECWRVMDICTHMPAISPKRC